MRCGICARTMDVPNWPHTLNCGGDCRCCMAEAGDPECIAPLATYREENPAFSELPRHERARINAAILAGRDVYEMDTPSLNTLARAWHKARLAACAAPMGNAKVWTDLGAAETALAAYCATMET